MKVAVFLRGHKRNWEYTKTNFINFCESLSDHVDYYVAIWQNDHDLSSMVSDFPQENLKAFLPTFNDFHYGPLEGPAFQATLLTQYKNMEEINSGQKYDFILDTRCDMSFTLLRPIEKVKEYSLGYTTQHPDMHMDDVVFVYDNLVLPTWNCRGFYSEHFYKMLKQQDYFPHDIHEWYFKYAIHQKINIYKIPWFMPSVVRPCQNYNNYSVEDRKKVILDLGLDPKDFTKHLDPIRSMHMSMN